MTAKEKIGQAFMQIYAQKAYNQMTVKEICVKIPMARTTFYAYYQNIDEVKAEIENYLIAGIVKIAENLAEGNMPQMDLSLFLSETMNYIEKNWESIYIFMVLQPNMRFIGKWKEAVKRHFLLRFPQKVSIANYELIAETIASGVMGAYSYWLNNPEKVDIDSLNRIVIMILEQTMDLL